MIKQPTPHLKEVRNQLKKKPVKQNYLPPVLHRRPYVSPYKSSYSKIILKNKII